MSDYRGREIPWLPVVRFHKEVVTRAEEGFLSLNGRDDQAERWTSLENYEPADLAGPWKINFDDIRSQPFRLAIEQGQHESLFLGGPCYLGWSKPLRGNWVPHWRPLLFREIELRPKRDRFDVVPKAGTWCVSPLLYSLLDRLEVDVGESLVEFAKLLIEKAAGYRQIEEIPIERSIFRALIAEVPDAEADVTKEVRPDIFNVRPTSWVLFAPTSSFSALTRNLMRDYERLEEILTLSPERIGGLRLLEDRPVHPSPKQVDVLPLVPLNDSQRMAVQRILEERPLTVISGPPGTGKSQVVVSLLLNAWAHGQTVLFASNNNKAVDVVRERVERFESEFPIAVRAGAQQKQNIQEVLRRTLNLASKTNGAEDPSVDARSIRDRRAKLDSERRTLQNALESGLPQRIDESRKTALSAYGEYRSTLSSITTQEQELENEKAELGFEGGCLESIEESVQEAEGWVTRIQYFKDQIAKDNRQRQELQAQIIDIERVRNRTVAEIGLSEADAGDWQWLLFGPSPEQVADWEQRFREVLDKPVEHVLEPIEWHDDFERWMSSEEAKSWATKARDFAEVVLRSCGELAPKIEQVRHLTTVVEEGRSRINEIGVPMDVDIPIDCLRQWIASYAEYSTRESSKLDILPWSQHFRLRRNLRDHEKLLRPKLPLEIWTRIGELNAGGRESLAPIVETTCRWIELRRQWETSQSTIAEIDARFSELRSRAAALRLREVPTSQNSDEWQLIVAQCEELALVADSAARAWIRRSEKEATEEQLRTIAKEWSALASGLPIREAWRRGQGENFDLVIRALAEAPGPENVLAARAVVYTGSLTRLIECWRAACDHEQNLRRLDGELMAVSDSSEHIESWWRERPQSAFVLSEETSDWPNTKEAEELIKAVAGWCDRKRTFENVTKPSLLVKAQEELEWACAKLRQAVDVLPQGSSQAHVKGIFDTIVADPGCDWQLPDINQAFAEFSPERMRARIDRIESELERSSFEDAKAEWLDRIRKDDDAIRAVDRLEKSLRRNKGVVVLGEYDTFRSALRAVPIWITTAQASQAIPLDPDLFDIVVIDEASQCTLTNLLPLMYRGRTLTVIGDDNQLPAIPTIRESEELALASKYEVEEDLDLVGHATNDVYKAATESLPRRRADVLMLNEHFRSNPQIIGFSNRHIYLQRLELKKDPSWGNRLPVGGGVHMISVSGTAERGSNGRSWVNQPESEEVISLILKLKQSDSRSLTIGVVTPFAAQKELLRKRLNELRIASEILVDTAYGFQGDERDIMIFSPVVAKGISGSASRWVESPPNLINVAITRAREALFVIGDIDYCLQQEGILRKLALYCRDIDLLRRTSEAELELFSWMVVNGWEPKVHPQIGDLEVDFTLDAASGERIAIEVDGKHHIERMEHDKSRDAFLQAQDYTVLRFSAREVLETPFDVIHQIRQAIELRE